MYIKIGNTIYRGVKNLSLPIQTDLASTELPINTFSCEVYTQDVIQPGSYVYLYDDRGEVYLFYIIDTVEYMDKNVQKITASSRLSRLDRVTLPAEMCSNKSVSDALDAVFDAIDISPYTIDEELLSMTLDGFLPEQTGRERLLHICFVCQAYVEDWFSDTINVRFIDDEEVTLIPLDRTFFKPSIQNRDIVTAVKIKAYSYTQGTPLSTDEWVTDGTNYYIETYIEITLDNVNAPADALPNVIEFDGVKLVNTDNASGILTYLANYYFNRTAVQLDVINNKEYSPGMRVIAYAEPDRLVKGYINRANFSFGVQSRSTLYLTAMEELTPALLRILYIYSEYIIGKYEITLPVDYTYTVTNPYIDIQIGGGRYIFRPQNAETSGTMVSGGVNDEEEYDVALCLQTARDKRILQIVSVDNADMSTYQEGTLVIA